MVQSGLVDDPRVSQLRLAAHLGLALLIFAAMFWLALSLLMPRSVTAAEAPATEAAGATALRRFALLIMALVFVQAIAGGLVAGIRAGLAYNTFPLMNGHMVPPEILSLEPWFRNFTDNIATVQFDHRMIAWLLAMLIPLFWLRARAAARHGARRARGVTCCWLALIAAVRARHRDPVAGRARAARRRASSWAPCCCSPRRSTPRMRCARRGP